jgi:hypothetical protein
MEIREKRDVHSQDSISEAQPHMPACQAAAASGEEE